MNEFYGPRIEQKLITKVCDVLNVVPGDYGSDKYKAVEAVQLMNLENNLSYSFSRIEFLCTNFYLRIALWPNNLSDRTSP